MTRSDNKPTVADSSDLKVSALRARMCVKEEGDRVYRTTYKASVSKCQQYCQQVSRDVLTHTREETADSRKLLARIKRKLKKGPKMGRKALARFVVLEAVEQGFHGIEKSR
jgi:hypothetical protein